VNHLATKDSKKTTPTKKLVSSPKKSVTTSSTTKKTATPTKSASSHKKTSAPVKNKSTSIKQTTKKITPKKANRNKGLTKKQKKLVFQLLVLVILLIVGSFGGYEYIGGQVTPNPYDALPLGEYYEGAEGLEGRALRTFLDEIVQTNIITVNYGTARTALVEADKDPNNPSNVLTIYSRQSVKGEWDGITWTREHVWPNSRLGIPRVNNTSKNQGSDLHNLRAIIQSVNSSRSNKVFDVATTSETYFPGDADKGDVARILFYMVIRYDFLELTDEILTNDSSTNYSVYGTKMSRFSVLMDWHLSDPVDDFERNRNNVIYEYQNNRNPFIDHPEFASLIFEHSDYTPLHYQGFVIDYSILVVPIYVKPINDINI
jgi:endonuclease I